MNTLNQTQTLLNMDGLSLGERAVVLNIQTPIDCACRLRSMGLCEGASVCILQKQDPVIIQCEQTCMAVCRSLLSQIVVVHQETDTHIPSLASAGTHA